MSHKLIFFLLIINTFQVVGQTNYTLPEGRDTTSIKEMQFDFSSLEKPTSNSEKTAFLNVLIKQLDTLSAYFFTGYESYAEFEENLESFSKNLSTELQRNIHLVKLNADTSYDFIYDRLDFEWDNQQIYILLKTDSGWKINLLPGAIVLKMDRLESGITSFETYQWACCDFPYDYYYHSQIIGEEVIKKSITAFSRFEQFPNFIQIDTTKQLELNDGLFNIFAHQKGEMIKISTIENSSSAFIIEEKSLKSESYYLVQIPINNELRELNDCDYLIGWINSNSVK